ncbi:MAG TPA: glycosyltransferase family 4 protein [Flavisolibacter sp.]|nr:glycosyltransferase family 4 protein [Flavisolibacter sp.]
MRLLILNQNYPHPDNIVGDVFVHVRAKAYAKHHQVQVFCWYGSPFEIEYEGMPLKRFADEQSLLNAIQEYKPDRILIHFYQSWMLEKLLKVTTVPVIIWVHGFEALGWYRRLFNFKLYSPVLLNYARKNTVQQYRFRKLIKFANKSEQIKFVFVSNWMRKITETDTLSKIKNYSIIPNPIDTELFSYSEKPAELRKKVLLLRSFDSRKYANDISVEAILLLSKKDFFKEFSFTIIGKGNLFDSTLAPIKHLPNVSITKNGVRQVLIPALHKENGIFLCPTRQDAQGVSMCEAMSSGLVVITSNNTAIPEYVENGKTGLLTNSPQEVADAMEQMLMNPEKFQTISSAGARSMRELCDIETISEKELILIEGNDHSFTTIKKRHEHTVG